MLTILWIILSIIALEGRGIEWPWLLVIAGLLPFVAAGGWKALAKADLPGWGVFVPFYDFYLLVKLAARPNWVTWVLIVPTAPILISLLIDGVHAWSAAQAAAAKMLARAPASQPESETAPATQPESPTAAAPTSQPTEWTLKVNVNVPAYDAVVDFGNGPTHFSGPAKESTLEVVVKGTTQPDTHVAAKPPASQPAELALDLKLPGSTGVANFGRGPIYYTVVPSESKAVVVIKATTQPASQPEEQAAAAAGPASSAKAKVEAAPSTYLRWNLAIELISLVAFFLLMLDVAQNLGKGAGFGVLLYFPILLGIALPHLMVVLGSFSTDRLLFGLFHAGAFILLAAGTVTAWPILGFGQSRFVRPPSSPHFPPPFPPLSPLVLEPILRVAHLRTYFPVRAGVQRRVVGYVKAVDDVNFDVPRGKTLGLVGESGCGKTTVARTVVRLIPATHGAVLFNGLDLLALDGEPMRQMRRHMQIIFQDPVGSLNPRMTVGSIVGEPLKVHHVARGMELADRVGNLLRRVGLSPDYINRYPHEFSGGQRQRIGIARALALEPELIVCDEPVSALDVSIQSQILNLLADLQAELGLSYLFIAHNLAVIEHFCDVVAVMYLGKIVEQATAEELYRNPKHPYTMALMSAAPSPEPDRKRQRIIPRGEVPSPVNPPSGCPYHPRCHMAEPRCVAQVPTLDPKQGEAGHVAACLVTK